MFTHHRTKGIVLKKEDFREADQLFTVYTEDFGKVELLGRGIRKVKSKLRSGIDAFSFSEVEFIQGKGYKTLTDALTINKFERIKKNLKQLIVAHKIAELVDSFIKGEEADEGIWNLLNETFNALNKFSFTSNKYQLFYYYFLWKFLSVLGYQPELKDSYLYHNKEKEIGKETVKIIKSFLNNNWEKMKDIEVDKQKLGKLKEASDYYLSETLEQIK